MPANSRKTDPSSQPTFVFKGTVQELKREIAGLSAKIKEQDSRIEKVNDLLELSKGAPRTIASSR